MFLLPLLSILLPLWLGQRYGIYVKKKSLEIHEGPLGSAVGATLGLFAFMLGFTFQMVINRFDKRKELFVTEMTDIRTSFLYAGLIPEPLRSQARNTIVAYVDLRVEFRKDLSRYEETKLRSLRMLDSLWKYAEVLAAQDRSSEAYSLYTSAVAGIVNLFNQRVAITEARLPKTVLRVLSFVAFFSTLLLGYQFGISGRVSTVMNLLLGITFAAVMWLIFALDNPDAGIIQISDAPLKMLHQQLHQR